MSLDDLKKKAKLSLDDMLDNKDVGKTVNVAVHTVNKSELELKKDYKNENNAEKSHAVKHPCKMTFYMTQEIFDAFNYIYARRLIKKKKVDKGSLFCEIVQFFIENGGE